MAEPARELRNPVPRTELGKLLAPTLWEQHPMAPRRDLAMPDDTRSALVAITSPDGIRLQFIATAAKHKDGGFTVTIEPTGGMVHAHPEHLATKYRVTASDKMLPDALKAALDKVRADGYNPDVNGLPL